MLDFMVDVTSAGWATCRSLDSEAVNGHTETDVAFNAQACSINANIMTHIMRLRYSALLMVCILENIESSHCPSPSSHIGMSPIPGPSSPGFSVPLSLVHLHSKQFLGHLA